MPAASGQTPRAAADSRPRSAGQPCPPAAEQMPPGQHGRQHTQKVSQPDAALVGVHQNFGVVGPKQQPAGQQRSLPQRQPPPRRRTYQRRQPQPGQRQADRGEQLRPEGPPGQNAGKRLEQPDRHPALAQELAAGKVGIDGQVVHVHGGHRHGVAVAGQHQHRQHGPEQGPAGQLCQRSKGAGGIRRAETGRKPAKGPRGCGSLWELVCFLVWCRDRHGFSPFAPGRAGGLYPFAARLTSLPLT